MLYQHREIETGADDLCHAMKTYGKNEAFLISAPDDTVISFTLRPLYRRGKILRNRVDKNEHGDFSLWSLSVLTKIFYF